MRIIYLILLLMLFACGQQKSNEVAEKEEFKINYASGFSISEHNGYTILTVQKPYKTATSARHYALVPDGATADLPPNYTIIRTPVETIACSSTTHLAAFELIGQQDNIVAFPSTGYVYSSVYRDRIESGALAEVGTENALNIERLLEIDPDVFIGYTINGDMGQYELLERSGIPVFLNAEYLEETPLGRAEWIKVAGLLLNNWEAADSVFQMIEQNYLAAHKLAANRSTRPTVISGIVYQGTWYMPGGNSWAARYFEDAGADFLYSDSQETGSIPLSFESVYEKANNAHFWIGASSVDSYSELLELDKRYALFRAFGEQRIYNYNKRTTPGGGNDYFEMAIMRPDLVLTDLVSIFHGRPGSNEELTYFKPLESE